MFVLVFGCVVGFVVVLRHPQPMSLHEGLCQVDANATYGLEDMSYKIKSIENQLSVHSRNWCVPCQRSKEDFFLLQTEFLLCSYVQQHFVFPSLPDHLGWIYDEKGITFLYK